MAAVIGRTEVRLKKTGVSTTIPDSPVAKLMYYFNCVCSCVEPNSDASIRRLRAYKENYSSLSNEEHAKLLMLCLALSPDKLIGSIFFPAGDNDIERDNDFFEIQAVSTKFVIAQSLLVGGQQRKVHKIMMFKKRWIENNYIKPFRSITVGGGLPSPQRPNPPPQRRASPPRQRRPNPPPQRRQSPPPQRRASPPPQRRASPQNNAKRNQPRSRLCVIL